jgi:hypothetical protein
MLIFSEEISGAIVTFPSNSKLVESSIKIMSLPKFYATEREHIQIEAVGSHMSINSAEALFSAGNNV